jgi:hypothetical protein
MRGIECEDIGRDTVEGKFLKHLVCVRESARLRERVHNRLLQLQVSNHRAVQRRF